jgi:hypothetical protein
MCNLIQPAGDTDISKAARFAFALALSDALLTPTSIRAVPCRDRTVTNGTELLFLGGRK